MEKGEIREGGGGGGWGNSTGRGEGCREVWLLGGGVFRLLLDRYRGGGKK